MQDRVTEVQRLGFGKCSLQVQAPEHGSIKTVEDLAGKRIVTSFEVVAGEYFDKLDDRLNLVGDQKTKIQYVGGSVEAACALGLADGIGASISSVEILSIWTLILLGVLVDLVGVFPQKSMSALLPIYLRARIWRDHACSWSARHRHSP